MGGGGGGGGGGGVLDVMTPILAAAPLSASFSHDSGTSLSHKSAAR